MYIKGATFFILLFHMLFVHSLQKTMKSLLDFDHLFLS